MARVAYQSKKSGRRTCRKCGRKLSQYNTTGQCFSHAVPADSTGDWDHEIFQGLRRDERVRVGVSMECTMILGKPGGICSPGKNPIQKEAR